MARSRHVLWAALLAAAPVVLASCGGTGKPPPSPPPTEDEYLTDLKMMVEEYQATNKGAAPAGVKDFRPFEPNHPGGYFAVNAGGYTYYWGAGLSPGGKSVLAATKDIDKSNGRVLLQDGTIQPLTAAEFAAAPKAGKK